MGTCRLAIRSFPLFSVLLVKKSASSAFASCSLSNFCKVISGISSSGASLSMCLIYIWFQTQAKHFDFFPPPYFLQFDVTCGSAGGRHSRGPLTEKEVALMLSIAFLSFPSLTRALLPFSPSLAAAAGCVALLLSSPLLSLHLSVCLSTQRVAWELKTSSAGAASSCSLCLFFKHFLWRSHLCRHSHTVSSTKVS